MVASEGAREFPERTELVVESVAIHSRHSASDRQETPVGADEDGEPGTRGGGGYRVQKVEQTGKGKLGEGETRR